MSLMSYVEYINIIVIWLTKYYTIFNKQLFMPNIKFKNKEKKTPKIKEDLKS